MRSSDDFLALLKNVKPAGTNKWMACCPAHNDGQHPGDQSLSVTLKDDKLLIKCFAGCQTPDIVKSLGLTMSDLFIGEKVKPLRPATPRQRRQIVATYPYHNLGNQLVFEVVRYEPKAFSQRRPDGQGGYINNLAGVERVIYRLPQITAAIQRGETILAVEGEKDADNLVKLGFEATTSPQGAGNWKSAMAGYYRGAGTVVIIPDKDEPGRAYAREVTADITPLVSHVKMLELPGDSIKDASDWIAAGGTRELLEELVKSTADYQPPVGEPGDIDYDAIRKLLKAESNNLYTIINGKFHRIVRLRDGGEDEQQLCNFVARVTQDILKDNGATAERFLRIQGRLNGSHLPPVTVPESQFDSMMWARKKWGVKTQIEKSIDKVERHLCQTIIKSSGKVPEHIIYTHTGWREIDGQWLYLTAGGAVGRPDVEVELPPPMLNKFRLPQTDGNLKESVSKSMDLLLIADMKVTLPIFILPYLAVLNVFEDMTFTAWLVGRSGSLKSTLTALALSHFGDFTHKNLRVSWFGTRTELEKLSFTAKDILFPIDDYAPPANPAEARELNKTVEYIIRSYANRQGKVRANADMTSQETFYPRGLLVTSGEQLPPPGVSRSARILPIPIERADFVNDGKEDYYLLTRAQKDRRYYPVAMAHYIRWIQANWKAVGEHFHAYLDKYLQEAPKEDTHLRLVETVSLMQAGYRTFLDFAVDSGVVQSSAIGGYLESGWEILTGLLRQQNIQIENEKPGRRYMELINSLLLSGKVIIRQRNEIGTWSPAEAGPGQTIIGWDDISAGVVYIIPDIAYKLVFEHCRNIGQYFGSSPEATWKDLSDLGYLAAIGEEGSRSYLKKKRELAGNKRLLWFKRSVFFGEE